MKRSNSIATIPAMLLGIVLSALLVGFAVPAYAQDPDPVHDNLPGLFELGWNEDTLEDVDLDILKGPNRGARDTRANITRCLDADLSTASPGDCRDLANEYDGSEQYSDMPAILPPGMGPDWGSLFTGVMNENAPDAEDPYYYVVPTFKDQVEFDGSYIALGPNGVDDYVDFGAWTAVFIGDHISAGGAVDDTTMVSNGSDSNDDQIETYAWGTDSVPSKDDITNAYCYATQNLDEDLIIYCGVERLSNDGSSHVDIELNAEEVGTDVPPPCPEGEVCYMVGNRVEGDLMVSLNFTNGGDFGSLGIRKWDDRDESLGGQTWGDPVVELDQEGCNYEIENGDDTIAAGAACAFNNNDLINGGPWPNFIKDVVPLDTDVLFTNGELPRNAFSEFGLNVTEILGQTQCISYVQIKTRTSHSFTSQLKDFAVRPFPVCGSDIRTEIHAAHAAGVPGVDIQDSTVKVGTVIHDFAEVMITGPGITQDPTGVVDFYLYEKPTFGPGSEVGTCEGDPIATSLGRTLDPGTPDDSKATAESVAYSNLKGGYTYSFHADFISNDAGFPSSSLPLDDCEVITIEKYPSVVSTQIHQKDTGHTPDIQWKQEGDTVYVGLTIHDHAYVDVDGIFPSAPTPTGDVQFTLFDEKDCTGTPDVETIILSSGAAISAEFTPAGDTELSYKALYLGDDNYLASDDSDCERLDIIKYDSVIWTEIHKTSDTLHDDDIQGTEILVGPTVHDHAYVEEKTGVPNPLVPTGKVIFTIYQDLECIEGPLGSYGGITWNQEITLSVGEALTESFTPPGASTFSIFASYAGDDNYHPATYRYRSENYPNAPPELCEPLIIGKYEPYILTKVIVRDLAEVTGDMPNTPPTGTVKFETYRTADCSGTAADTVTRPLSGNLVAEQEAASEQLLTVSEGVVSYLATYSGNEFYDDKAHDCELVVFSVE
jgi:hypothetical protein